MTGLVLGGTVRPRPVGLALLQPQAIRMLDLVALQLKAQVAEATRQGQLTRSSNAPSTRPSMPPSPPARTPAVDTTDLPTAIAQLFEAFKAPTPGSWKRRRRQPAGHRRRTPAGNQGPSDLRHERRPGPFVPRRTP
ncbi:hypothetical protein [Streptomyces sp. MNU103]|uniref:hypothetical protein n=1 Tax=Streptomyces sp. MNU103 TaxID=2560024 RepID=UPI001E58030E|nr:hypothetical protein [Streptomyces sp. MNU103]